MTVKAPDKFIPYPLGSVKDKSSWTEKRLQEQQTRLFKLFNKCKSKCNTCPHRECDDIVSIMEKYLTPYGISIFKRRYKKRATCEEMNRVVPESVNALLMDIWGKKKRIHTSFGKMLTWKMVYYLDGKINLFDTDRYCSLERLQSNFDNSGDVNGEDLIEYYSETFQDALTVNFGFKDIKAKEAANILVDLLEASLDNYNKYTNSRDKYAIYLRSIFAFNRFINLKDNYLMFKGKQKAQFYYEKLIDIIKRFLVRSGSTYEEFTI